MAHQPDDPTGAHQSAGQRLPTLLLVVGALLVGGAVLAGLWAFDLGGSRLLGIGIIGLLMSLAWLDNYADTRVKAHHWRQVAEQAGLTCQTRVGLTGSSVQVTGSYRGRPLAIFTTRHGKGQVQSTRVALTVDNPTRATLRMRGPFARNAAVRDTVTSDLFATSEARQFGSERRFFIRSQPIHLATRLVASHPLWEELLALEPLVSIELDDTTIFFERLGVVTDAAHLLTIFDLLSRVADVAEEAQAMATRQPVAAQP
jgi:hypothetical protein